MFVGRVVVLASGTGHTGVRWCHRAGMPAPTCTQFAFECEYWAGQSLFFLFFYLSLHISVLVISPLFYYFPFPFPSPLRLVPLSSHPLLISSLVFFPLSANTYGFRFLLYFYTQRYSHHKSMKVKAEVFFSAKRQYLSIQKATVNKNTNHFY